MPPVSGARPEQALVNQAIRSCAGKKNVRFGRATAIGATSLWGLRIHNRGSQCNAQCDAKPPSERGSFGRERKLPRRCAHLNSLIALLDLTTRGTRSPQKPAWPSL